MKTTAFCVTGWHYPRDFYQAISGLSDVDVFVLSHKRRSQIPAFIFELLPDKNILFRSNIGYDWGCYQQFLGSGLWRGYEFLFFMHDDIIIHDFGFIGEAKRLLENHAVVGNGLGQGSVSYTGVNLHPYAYAHSSWKPDSYTFQHHTVRGSFFATTNHFLQEILPFEVFWDPFKIDIGFGNWSTKATCGKMEDAFGPGCFGYLSDTFGSSPYITEHYRGDRDSTPEKQAEDNRRLYPLLKKISTRSIEIHYQIKKPFLRRLWIAVLMLILGLFSKKLY